MTEPGIPWFADTTAAIRFHISAVISGWFGKKSVSIRAQPPSGMKMQFSG
jgi:hypothetical protein